MVYVIKALLPVSEQEYFKNTEDSGNKELVCTNMVICNTSVGAVKVSLSFYAPDRDQTFEMGAVLFEYSLGANEYLELKDRRLYPDDTIAAYADTADSVSLSIDILGINGRYMPPLP